MSKIEDIEFDSSCMTRENGLIRRWCFNTPNKGCSHYITTREELNQTDICSNYANRTYKNEIIEFLRHQPYCSRCLYDTNSYKFKAWYDINKYDLEKFIRVYDMYYPSSIKQPFLYVRDDNMLSFGLDVVGNPDNGIGDLDLDTMMVEFFDYDFSDDEESEEDLERYINIFDLSKSDGWSSMLERYPQKLLLDKS